MARKFKVIYHTFTIRYKNWDYTKGGAYFLTICTKNRRNHLGSIEDGLIELSETGEMVHQCWVQIPEHVPDVNVDEFIIMPDHLHGIILIHCTVEMLHATSLRDKQWDYKTMSGISPKSGSLSAIIRSFKSAVTKQTRKINPEFAWQSRFYDHIIRDKDEYYRIRYYIRSNPLKCN